ncbi:MAG: glycosyl hydrolase 108 family protein [Rikenellaceae bacterium]
MAKVETLAPFIFSWEGGFVNHPNDKGGATNMGVTIATYKAYRNLKGLDEPTVDDLKNISTEEVVEILKTMYWDKAKADEINDQSIANIIVDWVWASGVWGIKYTQRALGLTDDGVVGPLTIGAINRADPLTLFNTLWASREAHFLKIVTNNASQQVFLKGWLNRLGGIKFGSLVCNGGKVIDFNE